MAKKKNTIWKVLSFIGNLFLVLFSIWTANYYYMQTGYYQIFIPFILLFVVFLIGSIIVMFE